MKMLIEKLINYILVNNFILLCSFFIGVRIIFSLIWKDSIYLLNRIFENLSCGLWFLWNVELCCFNLVYNICVL